MKYRSLFYVPLFFVALSAHAQTCSDSNSSATLTSVTLQDTTEHASNDHHVAITPTTKCVYAHSNSANCNTTCTVDKTAGSLTSETGQLSASGTHMVNLAFNSGSGSGTNAGVTCNGTFAGGATNCFAVSGTCFISLSITGSGPGASVSISTNGRQVWSSGADNIPNNCGAVADPQNQTAGGGCCFVPPDPCLNSATITPSGSTSTAVAPTCSPIIIDVEGEGFYLTSANEGVMFDITGTGHMVQIAWTDPMHHNAFLALDRNHNGLIDNGTELFGNFSPQPTSGSPNGFLALAEFDKPENGGNGDGIIDEHDSVYQQLVLWIDENHDGVSQPNELHTLPEFGIHSISLSYFESHRQDDFGNQFRYKARINPDQRRDRRDQTPSGEPGRFAYDVFLVTN